MPNLKEFIYINIDFGGLPEVRKCTIIKYLKGKTRPVDKYILTEINPPLSSFPECNIFENINEIILALVNNLQNVNDVGKEIVMAEVVYPMYDNKGNVDEGKSIKLGHANLYSDFDTAKENALTYKEMIWQFRERNCLDIKIDFNGNPDLRRCKIVRQLQAEQTSKDKYYLVEIIPSLNSIVGGALQTILAFSHGKYDLIAVKDGEITGEVFSSENLREGMFDKKQYKKLGDCIIYFKF